MEAEAHFAGLCRTRQFCLICELFIGLFFNTCSKCFKNSFKILYCIPDDFKELVTINFTGSLCKTLSWIRCIPICKIGYKLIVVVWKHDFMFLFRIIFIHINWLWLAKDWYIHNYWHGRFSRQKYGTRLIYCWNVCEANLRSVWALMVRTVRTAVHLQAPLLLIIVG